MSTAQKISLFNRIKQFLRIRPPSLKEEVEDLIEEKHAAGEEINPEEKLMLKNVLSFTELIVNDVMIPRADIIAIEVNIGLDELKKIVQEKVHTRIPVYRKTLDDVIGFIHIKDLLLHNLWGNEHFQVEGIIRQILFVPPSMKVIDLLKRMRLLRVHMAMVVDEYGGTTGLVTMEDLMEEIVGEIEDEHDDKENLEIKELTQNIYETSGRTKIVDIDNRLAIKMETPENMGGIDTIGGLITMILGRVPISGEVVRYGSDYEFKVIEADLRRVKKVLIRISNDTIKNNG